MRRLRVALSLVAVGLAALWLLPTAFAQSEQSFETWCAAHGESCALLRTALATAGSIPATDQHHAMVLVDIGAALAEIGFIDGARHLFASAAALAPGIPFDPPRFNAWDHIALTQAEAGLWNEALNTARDIPIGALEPDRALAAKIGTLSRIAEAQTSAGMRGSAERTLTEARNIVASMVDPIDLTPDEPQWSTMQRKVRDQQTMQSLALRPLIRAELHAELWDQARRTAGLAAIDRTRVRALTRLAIGFAETGRPEDARASAAKALASVRQDHRRVGGGRQLHWVAEAQARLGLLDEALKTARTEPRLRLQAQAFATIARAQAAGGSYEAARATFAEAMTQIRRSDDSYARQNAIGAVSIGQAAVGFAKDALSTASLHHDPWRRSGILQGIVRAQVRNGEWSSALTSVAAIPNISYRTWSLAEIARAQIAASQPAEAEETIRAAAVVAAAADDSGMWHFALSALAAAQAEAGHWDDAFATARTTPNVFYHDQALRNIAVAQVAAGHWDEARATANSIVTDSWRSEALAALARAQLDDALALARD